MISIRLSAYRTDIQKLSVIYTPTEIRSVSWRQMSLHSQEDWTGGMLCSTDPALSTVSCVLYSSVSVCSVSWAHSSVNARSKRGDDRCDVLTKALWIVDVGLDKTRHRRRITAAESQLALRSAENFTSTRPKYTDDIWLWELAVMNSN